MVVPSLAGAGPALIHIWGTGDGSQHPVCWLAGWRWWSASGYLINHRCTSTSIDTSTSALQTPQHSQTLWPVLHSAGPGLHASSVVGESHWSGSRVQRLHSRISDTLTVTPTIPGCQTVPQIHETLSHCWINDGPASYTVDQHWLNKGSVSRVCWDTVMANTPMIPARHLVMVRVWLLMRTNTVSHVGLMLCQRRRRWHNIKPTWDQRPVFGVYPAAVHRLATQHNTKYINRKGCWLKHQSDQRNGQRHRKTVSDAHRTNKSTDLLVRIPAILRGEDTTHWPLS